jgi:VWFA-related protein
MRAILSMLVALSGIGVSAGVLYAQTSQAPVFRSGVEVMEVDVTVVDGKGNPVRDLHAPEFTVTIDGQPRRVVSAEFISDTQTPGVPPRERDPYVSNNTDRRPGRLIMLVIDRNNIDTHTLRGATDALKSFVNGISPEDRLALVTVPPPGPNIDFTTNRAQVIDALGRIAGMDDRMIMRFGISDYEAMTFENGSNPIVTQRLLFRVCGDTDPNTMSPCDRDVEQEALMLSSHIRQVTAQSVASLGALLKGLRDVEGAKSMIILSQGLMIDGAQAEATALATLAAEARVNINVMMFATQLGSASEARISETASQDRDLREAGLETLAGRSRGSLFRIAANPQYVFDRLRNEISSHYMLAVEPADRDRDGRPHQIRVQVGRQGVEVRARRQVQYTVRNDSNWSRDVVMGRVLRSPSANTELPIRLSTYTFRDADPNKVKVILSAELDPESMEKELDVALGFAVFDNQGKPVLSGQERKIYSANTTLPIRYELAVAVDPGNYRVRLAAVDAAGKAGSVEREVTAFGMTNHELALGDLVLSSIRQSAGNADLRMPVVLQVTDGMLGTYTEIYTNKPGTLDDTKVVFEVADTADGPTLQSSEAEFRERPDKTMRQSLAVVPVGALPPGRYIARAIVTRGGKNVGKLSRPFYVAPGSASSASSASIAPDGPATPGTPGTGAAVSPSRAAITGIVLSARPAPFKKEDVLSPEMLRGAFEVIEKNHPAAKAATAKARTGKLEGTALMALDAGEQGAGSILRGLELLMKGQLDQAANQFGVAMRSAPDAPIASFYLGACYAAAGRDKEAVSSWERARAAKLPLPALQTLLADGWLRLGRPADALEPLRESLDKDPQNDAIRKNLAIAQSQLGLHEQAYPTVVPFLDRNPNDADALLVALHALYQVRVEGKTIRSAEDDKAKAALYSKAYAASNGPHAALVEKWAEFLAR